MGLEGSLSRLTDCSLPELRTSTPNAMAATGRARRRRQGRRRRSTSSSAGHQEGRLTATFVLEDLNASIEAFVFPKTMGDYGALLDDDAIVVVKARLDMRDERLKLVAMEVPRPELVADGLRDLRISLPLGTLTDRTVDDLKRLLSEHPGHSPVLLHVGDKVLRLPSEFNVDAAAASWVSCGCSRPHAIQSRRPVGAAGRSADRRARSPSLVRARGAGTGAEYDRGVKSRKIGGTAPGVDDP